jgi:hypothetical protein
MEELLKQLGFKQMTGPLWANDLCVFHLRKNSKPEDIINAAYTAGLEECRNQIKASLGID